MAQLTNILNRTTNDGQFFRTGYTKNVFYNKMYIIAANLDRILLKKHYTNTLVERFFYNVFFSLKDRTISNKYIYSSKLQ